VLPSLKSTLKIPSVKKRRKTLAIKNIRLLILNKAPDLAKIKKMIVINKSNSAKEIPKSKKERKNTPLRNKIMANFKYICLITQNP